MRYFLAVSPGETPPPDSKCHLAHIGYRVGRDGELLRADGLDCRGGIMVLDSRGYAPCSEIVAECRKRGFFGVLANFRPENGEALLAALSAAGVRLILHERDHFTGCRVLISTAVSGGSYSQRMAEAAEKYGSQNIILDAERMCASFLPPDPGGQGRALPFPSTPKEGFCFSRELLCSYRVFFSDGRARFILFDDRAGMERKLSAAEGLGIDKALFLLCEWA